MDSNLFCNSLWAIIYSGLVTYNHLFFELCFLKASKIPCLMVLFDFLSWKGCFSCSGWENIWKSQFLVTGLVHEVCCIWYKAGGSLVVYHHTSCPSLMPFSLLFIFLCRSEFFSGIIYLLHKECASTFFFCHANLLALNSFGVCLSEKVFFLHFWKISLLRYRFLLRMF